MSPQITGGSDLVVALLGTDARHPAIGRNPGIVFGQTVRNHREVCSALVVQAHEVCVRQPLFVRTRRVAVVPMDGIDFLGIHLKFRRVNGRQEVIQPLAVRRRIENATHQCGFNQAWRSEVSEDRLRRSRTMLVVAEQAQRRVVDDGRGCGVVGLVRVIEREDHVQRGVGVQPNADGIVETLQVSDVVLVDPFVEWLQRIGQSLPFRIVPALGLSEQLHQPGVSIRLFKIRQRSLQSFEVCDLTIDIFFLDVILELQPNRRSDRNGRILLDQRDHHPHGVRAGVPIEAAIEGPFLVVVLQYLGLALALPQVSLRTGATGRVRMILAAQRAGGQRKTLDFVKRRRLIGWQRLQILSDLHRVNGGVAALCAE